MNRYIVLGRYGGYIAELCIYASCETVARSIWNCYFGFNWTDVSVSMTGPSDTRVDRSLNMIKIP